MTINEKFPVEDVPLPARRRIGMRMSVRDKLVMACAGKDLFQLAKFVWNRPEQLRVHFSDVSVYIQAHFNDSNPLLWFLEQKLTGDGETMAFKIGGTEFLSIEGTDLNDRPTFHTFVHDFFPNVRKIVSFLFELFDDPPAHFTFSHLPAEFWPELDNFELINRVEQVVMRSAPSSQIATQMVIQRADGGKTTNFDVCVIPKAKDLAATYFPSIITPIFKICAHSLSVEEVFNEMIRRKGLPETRQVSFGLCEWSVEQTEQLKTRLELVEVDVDPRQTHRSATRIGLIRSDYAALWRGRVGEEPVERNADTWMFYVVGPVGEWRSRVEMVKWVPVVEEPARNPIFRVRVDRLELVLDNRRERQPAARGGGGGGVFGGDIERIVRRIQQPDELVGGVRRRGQGEDRDTNRPRSRSHGDVPRRRVRRNS